MKTKKNSVTKYFMQIFGDFKIFHLNYNLLIFRYLNTRFLCFLYLFSCSVAFCQNTVESKRVSLILGDIKRLQHTDENKALNLLNEALNDEKKLPDTLLIRLYDTAGMFYNSQEVYDYALNYYNSALFLQKKLNSQDQYITLKNIGNVYYSLGKNSTAKKYWLEALNGYKKNHSPKIYVLYNNLAILEETSGNYDNAKKMYENALASSIKLNDNKGRIMAYQNLGIVSFKLKELKEALNFFFQAKTIATEYKEQDDLAKTFYNLGYLYSSEPAKNEDSAVYYLNKSFLLSKNIKNTNIQKLSAETLIKLYEEDHKIESANFYLHQAKLISDAELHKMTDKQVRKVEFKYQQKLKEELNISKQKRKNWIYFTSFFILVTSCIILFLIYKLQKIKLIKTGLENELLLKKLEERNKEITKKSIEVLHTNEILDVTKRKLTGLKGKPELKTQVTSILNEIKSSQKVLNLEEFEKVFQDTHQDFYKKLIELHPDLSRTELKLSALLRLNLSTKDISAITGQSQNSINIARHRLRKKVKLQEHESIINYLINIV